MHSFWFLSFIEYSWFTVLLVSAVQQRGSVTHIHTPLFKMLFPCRLLQSIELSSLSYMVGSYLLPVLYIVMCILLHIQSRDMEVHIYILLLFSPSVVSNSLRLHELQHARLLCPSLSPWVCANLSVESVMPSNHSSSFPPFFCPQSFPASGSFPVRQLFASGGQSIGA